MAVWIYGPWQGNPATETAQPGTWMPVVNFGVTGVPGGTRGVHVFNGASWSSQASFIPPSATPPTAPTVVDAQQTGSAVGRVTLPTLPPTPNHERWQLQWRVAGTVDPVLATGGSGEPISKTVPHGSFLEAQLRHVNDLGTGPWSAWGPGSVIVDHAS